VGQLCWLQVPVRDISRAQKFYSEILGWESLGSSTDDQALIDAAPGVTGRRFFRKGDLLNGSFVLVGETHHVANYDAHNQHAVPFLPTFCVADCALTLERVAALGGRTHV
jgi:predicted enzyme related to lactoylglutathione lyase